MTQFFPMDKKIIIANWKSHKGPQDIDDYFQKIQSSLSSISWENKEVLIAPPHALLDRVQSAIKQYSLPFKVCSQDVSHFPEGAFTGEVSAHLVKQFTEFSIVGHSERRDNFGESDSVLADKVRLCRDESIEPIYCIQNESQLIADSVVYVAYEPPTAIGTGNPDTPEHIESVFSKILEGNSSLKLLYGGSVNAENIAHFSQIQTLSGFLIGGASLEAESFLSLLSW